MVRWAALHDRIDILKKAVANGLRLHTTSEFTPSHIQCMSDAMYPLCPGLTFDVRLPTPNDPLDALSTVSTPGLTADPRAAPMGGGGGATRQDKEGTVPPPRVAPWVAGPRAAYLLLGDTVASALSAPPVGSDRHMLCRYRRRGVRDEGWR